MRRQNVALKGNRLILAGSLDFGTFEHLVAAIPQLVEQTLDRKTRSCVFDLARLQWADLMELMCLLVAADWVASAGLSPRFEFAHPSAKAQRQPAEGQGRVVSRDSRKTGAFVGFSKNYRFVPALVAKRLRTDLSPPDSPGREEQQLALPGIKLDLEHADRTFLPITPISRETLDSVHKTVESVVERYLRDVTGEGAVPREQRKSLCHTIVYELCDNSLHHAYRAEAVWPHVRTVVLATRCWRSTGDSFGQYMREASAPQWLRAFAANRRSHDFLEICLVDGGAGIYASLSPACAVHLAGGSRGTEAFAEWPEREMVQLALSETRLSSDPLPDPTKGLGLYWMRRHVVDAWKGCLYLRSGSVRFVAHPYQTAGPDVSRVPWFPGVQLRLWLQMRDNEKELRRMREEERLRRAKEVSLSRSVRGDGRDRP